MVDLKAARTVLAAYLCAFLYAFFAQIQWVAIVGSLFYGFLGIMAVQAYSSKFTSVNKTEEDSTDA